MIRQNANSSPSEEPFEDLPVTVKPALLAISGFCPRLRSLGSKKSIATNSAIVSGANRGLRSQLELELLPLCLSGKNMPVESSFGVGTEAVHELSNMIKLLLVVLSNPQSGVLPSTSSQKK